MIQLFVPKLHQSRAALLVVTFAMLVTGCAVDSSNMSPDQQALHRANNRFATTTAEGALGGALLGALVGGVTGGGRGALIGAGAGGVLGGVAGYAVAQNNYSHSHTEANLNAAVQDADQQASQAREDADTAQKIAAEARAQSAQLQARYRAGQINASQYRASLASYKTSLSELQHISQGYGQEIDLLRGNAASARGRNGASLRSSSSDIQVSKVKVDRAVSDLADTLAATPS